MFLITFLICILIAVNEYRNAKRLYSPVFLFACFWAIISFMAGLQLYGLYESSTDAYVCVLSGVLSFWGGAKFSDINYKPKICSYVLSKKRFNIALVLCIVGLYLNIVFLIQFARSGLSISHIYYLMASTVTGEDTELSALYSTNLVRLQQFIGYPLLFTIVPIAFLEFLSSKKKFYLFIFVGLSVLRFCYDFRRLYLVIIVVFAVFVLILKKYRYSYSSKLTMSQKFKFLFFSLLFLCVYTSISGERRGEDEQSYSLFENMYLYYAGSIPYFSQRLELINDTVYTFGFSSFRGLMSPFCALGRILVGVEPMFMTIANENVNSLHNVVLTVQNGGEGFNSYATCFFQFFQDGGYCGIIIMSFLFGFYAYHLYLDVIYNKENRNIMRYSLFLSIFIFLSVLHFNGVVICYIWPFVIERFLYKKTGHLQNPVSDAYHEK